MLDEELSNISSHSVIHLNQSVLHYVTKVRHIANLTNVTFNGPAEITCAEGVGLVFVNITGLTLNNITIRECGVTGDELANINDIVQNTIFTSYQFRARIRVGLFVIGSTNLTLQNVTITETQGIGMVCVNVLGLVTLSNVTFHSNRPASIEECSKCLVPVVLSEEACVFNPSSVSGSLLLLYADNRHDNSVPNTQVNIVGNKFIDNLSCSLANIANSQVASSPSLSRGYQNATSTAGITIIFSQYQDIYSVDIQVVSSLFKNNSGYLGSAVSIETYRGAPGNNVSIENSEFLQNGKGLAFIPNIETYGGAISALSNIPRLEPSFNTSETQSNSFLTVLNCSFMGNSASVGGVFVLIDYLFSNFHTNISECSFKKNFGPVGSCMYVRGEIRETVAITISNSSIIGNSAKTESNIFGESQDTVIFLQKINAKFSDVTISHNIGSAISLTASNLFLSGIVLFARNRAFNGAALHLQSASKIILNNNTNATFLNNQAFGTGGAIMFELEYSVPCFLYFGTFDLYCLLTNTCFSEDMNISISFINNTARIGTSIFGYGLDCPWLYQMGFNMSTSILDYIDKNFHDVLRFIPNLTFPLVVSTDATKINVNTSNLTVTPGQIVSLQVTATDFFERSVGSVVTASTVSQTGVQDRNFSATIQQYGIQLVRSTLNQTDIQFNGTQSDNTTVRVFSLLSSAEGFFSVQFTNCSSFGYVYNDTYHACVCDPDLLSNDVTCDYTNGNLIRPTDKWIGELNGDTLVLSCLEGFCSDHISIDPMNLNRQCAENRAGVLCGECKESCSANTGLSGCSCGDDCSGVRNLILWIFLVAFSGVWVSITTAYFHFYVSDGFLYGLIFYSNTLYVFREAFFHASPNLMRLVAYNNFVFLSDQCLFEGMTFLVASTLQFILPIYIFVLMGIVTWMAQKLDCFNRRFTFSIPKTFATLLYITYNWLLNASFTVLVFKPITTSYGVEYRWRTNSNIEYFHGWHAALGVVSILTLLLLAVVAITLLCPALAYRFRIVQKLKPLMDAFQAPFKLKYSFWIGLELTIRVVFFILVIFVPEEYQLYCLGIIIVILLYVQTATSPYKEFWHFLVDNLLLNFLILHIIEVQFFPKLLIVSWICYSVSVIMYFGFVSYYFINRFPRLMFLLKRKYKFINNTARQPVLTTNSAQFHDDESLRCTELRESLLEIDN